MLQKCFRNLKIWSKIVSSSTYIWTTNVQYFTVMKDVYFHYQLWNEPFTMLSAAWPGVSNKGMFMLSIMGWVVIKTHFSSNECKLAHLLWWTSCPDSSISVIDQFSSCRWLTGDGSWGAFKGEVKGWKSRAGKRDSEWSKTWNNESEFALCFGYKDSIIPFSF